MALPSPPIHLCLLAPSAKSTLLTVQNHISSFGDDGSVLQLFFCRLKYFVLDAYYKPTRYLGHNTGYTSSQIIHFNEQ
jgi:hypothetical protein